jgi:hypothetical protein
VANVPSLSDLERQVRAAVTSGGSLDAVASRLPVLEPGEQVDIYRAQWFSRLLGILRADFPGTAAALGPEGFEGLARAYLAAHPPTDPNISRTGARLPAFVAAREGLPHREFLADLARVEWASTSIFDREDGPVLDPATLAGVPPERLAAARFPLASTAEIHEVRHAVNPFLDAVRDGGTPAVPGPGGPAAVLVFRSGTVVHRMDLPPGALALLRALEEGKPLGDAMESAAGAAGVPVEDLAVDVTRWFGEWAAGGVFAGAEPA